MAQLSAPTPTSFERTLREVRERLTSLLDELPDVYSRAYHASHDRIVRESIGKISGGTGDPTASIVGDPLDPRRPGVQAAIRRTLERAPKKLVQLESYATDIEREISKAMDRLDPKEGFEALRFPVSASQADLEESHAAQERRHDRGEQD